MQQSRTRLGTLLRKALAQGFDRRAISPGERGGRGMQILELHVAVTSNRLNNVIKVLTVIATIMLPLTVITSYYGMNFRLPEFAWDWGWLYALGLLAATAFGTWWYLRRRRWS